MAEANKPTEAPSKSHTIRWESALWEKVQAATRVLSYRQHLNLIEADLIRSAASRFADEVLGGGPESGIEAQEGAERAGNPAHADHYVPERRRLEDRRALDRAS